MPHHCEDSDGGVMFSGCPCVCVSVVVSVLANTIFHKALGGIAPNLHFATQR